METSNLERDDGYNEIVVKSFEEAVDYLKENTVEDESKFCLVDIDGTLFAENILKLPIVSHFVTPTITESVKSSFCSLVSDVFVDKNVAIVTNRNGYERVFWNSKEMIQVVKEICDVPMFTSLNRQLPGLNKKSCDNLLCKIMEYVQNRESLTIYSVEDHSFVSPFRSHFLGYLAKKLEIDCGFDIRTVNLVIKR